MEHDSETFEKVIYGPLPRRGRQYLIYPVHDAHADAICLTSPSLILIETPNRYCVAYEYTGKTAWIAVRELAQLAELIGVALLNRTECMVSLGFDYFGNGRFQGMALQDGSAATAVGRLISVTDEVLECSRVMQLVDNAGAGESAKPRIRLHLETAHAQFLAGLNQEALQTSRDCFDASCLSFNYFVGSNESTGMYRRQAATVAPALVMHLSSSSSASTIMLRAGIDVGAPLLPFASTQFSVPRYAIQRLVQPLDTLGVTPKSIGRNLWRKNPRALLRALASAGPKAWPSSLEQWEAVYTFVDEHMKWWDECPMLAEKIMQAAGRRQWIDLKAWIAKIDSNADIGACVNLLVAFRRAVAHRLVANVQSKSVSLASDGAVAQVGLARLLRWGQSWRRHYLDCLARKLANLDDTWDKRGLHNPFHFPGAIGELQLVFLDSYRAFVEEGLALSHCIARYFAEALSNASFFYSLRDARGRPLSTFQLILMPRNEKLAPIVSQHRGRHNRFPPPECKHALRQVLESVSKQLEDGSFREELSQLSGDGSKIPPVVREILDGEARMEALSLAFGGKLEEMLQQAAKLAEAAN